MAFDNHYVESIGSFDELVLGVLKDDLSKTLNETLAKGGSLITP